MAGKAPWNHVGSYPDIPPETIVDVEFVWGDCDYEGRTIEDFKEDFTERVSMWRYHYLEDVPNS